MAPASRVGPVVKVKIPSFGRAPGSPVATHRPWSISPTLKAAPQHSERFPAAARLSHETFILGCTEQNKAEQDAVDAASCVATLSESPTTGGGLDHGLRVSERPWNARPGARVSLQAAAAAYEALSGSPNASDDGPSGNDLSGSSSTAGLNAASRPAPKSSSALSMHQLPLSEYDDPEAFGDRTPDEWMARVHQRRAELGSQPSRSTSDG
eukprot:GHVT01006061.1.p1 GENE.GHVT01006061.1~~GHVT01006061.1.p1  ORF type:complete len:210 (+),score=26.13 GHVT01006061.1:579-1208(+)